MKRSVKKAKFTNACNLLRNDIDSYDTRVDWKEKLTKKTFHIQQSGEAHYSHTMLRRKV